MGRLMDYIDSMGPDGVLPHMLPNVTRIAVWKAWDYPLEAYQWAELVEHDKDREKLMITITRWYLEADQPAAEAWLEQSSLSEEARAKARVFPDKWRGRGARPYPPLPKA